jgi:predicted nucleotidyltransferase
MHFEFDIETCRQNFKLRQQRNIQEMEARRLVAREAVLAALQVVLPRHPEVRCVYLFGSVIREGMFHLESDVDVAVEGTNAEQYFALWRELNDAVSGFLIDLRDINQPSNFADTVRQRGELVFERKDPCPACRYFR